MIVVFIGFVALLVVGGFFAYRHEAKIWNNGICKQTGKPWHHFDNDSQGGRGYESDNHICWISWPVDRDVKAK